MASTTCRQSDDEREFVCRVMGLNTRRLSGWSDAVEMKKATNDFRWLRNNSPRLDDCGKRQLLDIGLIETCLWYCTTYFANEPLSSSILLQFLANFSVGHESAQRWIFESFRDTLRYIVLSIEHISQNIDAVFINIITFNLNIFIIFFRHFMLSSVDSKLLNNSMMLLYNLCLCDVIFREEILKDVNIVQQIMTHWTQNEIEYR